MIRNPVIVNLCVNGMLPTKRMTPHVPITPDEIARDVLECAAVGITAVHLHARDVDGTPTHRREVYGEILGKIRESRPELVIGVSCSGRNLPDFDPRAEVLDLPGDLRPDMASLTTSSLNFSRQASVNSPDTVRRLAERMRDRGILPELEVFDLGMANYAKYLLEHGCISAPIYANLFFGNVATAQDSLSDMAALVSAMPPDATLSFGGIGRCQRSVASIAIAAGYGVRIGIEDNIFADDARTRLATNRSLIEMVHGLAALHERPVMTSEAFRMAFGL
jgi:3-keto-5-aminohexanoate cleavage enzyme